MKLSICDLQEVEDFINAISSYALTTTIIAFSSVEINDDIHKFLF